MIKHAEVKHINFTRSAKVGRIIAKVCRENLKPCMMELGGKNSAIVLQDANIATAVAECVAGSFANVYETSLTPASIPLIG
jgi:acyl-CoA reductase-like NAD-dependent aldehyde dehydrogenase